jgi:hypothetical protein
VDKYRDGKTHPDLNKLSEKEHSSIKKSAIIIASLCFIGYIIIFFVREIHRDWQTGNPIIWQISTDLLSTFTSLVATASAVVWLSVTIEKETQNTFLMRMCKLIKETITLSKESIERMNAQEKKDAIKRITHNLLGPGNEHLCIFRENSLNKSLYGWRSNFIYEAKLEKYVSSSADDKRKYVLHQS